MYVQIFQVKLRHVSVHLILDIFSKISLSLILSFSVHLATVESTEDDIRPDHIVQREAVLDVSHRTRGSGET